MTAIQDQLKSLRNRNNIATLISYACFSDSQNTFLTVRIFCCFEPRSMRSNEHEAL